MRDPFLVGVLVVAAGLRLYGIDHGLPFVYNPDEANIMARALSVARGLDPGYYLYPSFFFYLVFGVMGGLFVLGWSVGRYESLAAFQARFFSDPSDFYVVGRLIGVACALATVALTYALVCRHFGKLAGRAAALFVAVAYVGVRDAHYLKHDVPSGLLFVLAVWAIDRAMTRRALLNDAIAGVVLGVGFATHYYMIFLAPVLVLGLWLKRGWRAVPGAITAGAVSAVTFFLLSPFVLLRFDTALEHMRANRQVVVDRSLSDSGGLFPSLGPYIEFLVTQGVGFLMLTLALVGFALMAARSRDKLALWGTFPLLLFGFLTYTFFAGRYLNPLLPALAAAAGLSVGGLAARYGDRAAYAMMVVASLQPLYRSVQVDRLFARPDTRTIARQLVLEDLPAGTTLALQSYSVPLPQSPESFRESLLANDALDELARGGKYASLLEAAAASPVTYELYFFGDGDEPNRIYIGYDELVSDLHPLRTRGVSHVVLRRPPITPPPALEALFERVAAEGALIHTVSPFREGAASTPYLDNEDWPPAAGLERKGPAVEIWSLGADSLRE